MNPTHPDTIMQLEEDPMMDASINIAMIGGGRRSFEESWNGLFVLPVCATAAAEHTTNKKMGHASFSDMGLYDFAKSTTTTSGNKSATSVLPKCVEEKSRAQFMKKLRLQRLKRNPPKKVSQEAALMARIYESDSALLRRDSEMDTAELEGLWYRAKHPRHCLALEQMAHSAPGSMVL